MYFLPVKPSQYLVCLTDAKMIEKRKIYVRTNMSLFKIHIYLKQYEG